MKFLKKILLLRLFSHFPIVCICRFSAVINVFFVQSCYLGCSLHFHFIPYALKLSIRLTNEFNFGSYLPDFVSKRSFGQELWKTIMSFHNFFQNLLKDNCIRFDSMSSQYHRPIFTIRIRKKQSEVILSYSLDCNTNSLPAKGFFCHWITISEILKQPNS